VYSDDTGKWHFLETEGDPFAELFFRKYDHDLAPLLKPPSPLSGFLLWQRADPVESPFRSLESPPPCGMPEELWGISRTEPARTLCEILNWKRPNGRLKGAECREFLGKLESRSVIRLP